MRQRRSPTRLKAHCEPHQQAVAAMGGMQQQHCAASAPPLPAVAAANISGRTHAPVRSKCTAATTAAVSRLLRAASRTHPALLVLLAVLMASPALAALARAAQDHQCHPPPAPSIASKPFCFAPDTISSEARTILTSSFPRVLDVSTPAKAAVARSIFDSTKLNMVSDLVKRGVYASAVNGTVDGVQTLLATPQPGALADKAKGKLLLYFHGGAYVLGSCHTTLATVAPTARAAGLTTLCVDYRLAPEHPYPAAVDDAVAVWRDVSKRYGAQNVAFIGDSSGGNLAVALLLRAAKEKLPMPSAVVLFAPWVELSKSGDSQTILTGVDPKLQWERTLQSPALAYAGFDRSKLTDPAISPVRADFSKAAVGDLPPILVQVGTRDSLLSSSVLLHRKLRAAGQPAEFSPWEAMPHVFQPFDIPEARAAADEAAAFLRRHLGVA